MAGQAQGIQKRENSPETTSGLPEPLDEAEVLRKHVAKLYGQGLKRPQIARAMVKHMSTNPHRPLEQQLRQVRNKLKRWEGNADFRDLVWEQAVVDLDMDSPAILRGISRSAKRGRVDAAKLALEITGRHITKGDQTAPNITIAFAGIPRPEMRQIADAEVVDEPSEDD